MSTPTEYDCSHTHELVCPYCGGEMSDSWEYGSGGEEDSEADCGHCSRTFRYSRNVSVSYTTYPIMGPHRLDEFSQSEEQRND